MSHDFLSKMLREQRDLQINSYKQDPATLSADEMIEFIRWNVLALEDELHEALGEVGWKPWATSKHVNREAFVSEMVDAWHFFMNLLLVAGVTPTEFFDKYMAKREKNAKRQEEGYDGVSTKCFGCGRALDDDAVLCYGEDKVNYIPAWCDETKRYNPMGITA